MTTNTASAGFVLLRPGRRKAIAWTLGILAVVAVLAMLSWWSSIGGLDPRVSVFIDGDEGMEQLLDAHTLSWPGALLGLLIAGLVLAVVVPVTLVTVVGVVLLALLLGLGLPLVIVACVVVVLLSPLLLAGWLLWKLLT